MSSVRITIMRVPEVASTVSPAGLAVPGADATAAALREQRNPSPPGDTDEHNPFAAPPKDSPERPWQPRRPADQPVRQQPPPPPPSDGPGGGTGGGGTGGGPGPRFDVTDPVQRRARYALLAGMWGLFFGLFSVPEVALLLGALAFYWGVSALRAKPKHESRAGGGTDTGKGTATGAWRSEVLAAMQPGPPPDVPAMRTASPYAQNQHNPQFTAALSGIIAGIVALAIVAVTYTVQIVYRDYYGCVNNALTQPARQSCNSLLPKQLQSVLGSQS